MSHTVFEENVVTAIERCIGQADGTKCVKLEDLVASGDRENQHLSNFAFEDDLMEGSK